jgi:hypothetical protein
VEKPVLLRQVRPEGHPDLDLTSDDAREPSPDRAHQVLGCEAIPDGLLEVRVAWLRHSSTGNGG